MSTDYSIEMEPLVSMTREEMDMKVDEHFAFEAEDDVAGVLATLSRDVEHDIGLAGRADAGP